MVRKTLQIGTDALQLAIPGPEPVVVRDREELHALLQKIIYKLFRHQRTVRQRRMYVEVQSHRDGKNSVGIEPVIVLGSHVIVALVVRLKARLTLPAPVTLAIRALDAVATFVLLCYDPTVRAALAIIWKALVTRFIPFPALGTENISACRADTLLIFLDLANRLAVLARSFHNAAMIDLLPGLAIWTVLDLALLTDEVLTSVDWNVIVTLLAFLAVL